MKTLLIYASWHGTVRTIAKEISALLTLTASVDLYNIEQKGLPSPEGYDCIIFGCCLEGGDVQKDIRNYISANCPVDSLVTSGMFCCSPLGDDETREILERDISAEIVKSFKVLGFMGSTIYARKLSFFERIILRQVSFAEANMETMDTLRIKKFTRRIEKESNLMEKEREYIRKNSGRIHYKAKKTTL